MGSTLSDADRRFLAEAIALSHEARAMGRHPFAALVVDASGQVVQRAVNDSRPPGGDPTRHAELAAAAGAARTLGIEALSGATLYSSAEPCAMCAGAVYWCGIGRVVYGLSERRLLGLTGAHAENPTLSLPCREVFARGQRQVEVLGPAMETEAAMAHDGFWTT
ncbi:nucleoside deaminase [Roseomonas sp. NAR14]|uniref:Nucleoside deaminase n=2 Tax=Roseomonas acroporae TaxID=2937791 RepID=A0A9X2BYX7_9PROT|nr:nucleoside deaminase [Roseomonas acroporae]MCK8787454.1 nucleoside deaminase [Roseomonas acroporae]